MYNYISEINHVSRVYIAAAILSLQFLARVMLFPMLNVLYFYISTFRSRCAVPNVAVFCSSLISFIIIIIISLLYLRSYQHLLPVTVLDAFECKAKSY